MEKILNDTFKQIEDITDVHEMTNVQLKRLIKKIEVEPRRLLLYSVPKAGKTTIFSQLPNSLIIDTEDGSDFVDALKIKIDTTLPFDKQYEQFMEILRAIWKEDAAA